MCNQTSNVPSVTLQTAVLMQVKEFAAQNKQFSVFDITKEIRSKSESGQLEIPEVEVSGRSFRFNVEHTKVKELFNELWNTGVFDADLTLNRSFNGTYFEYTPQLVTSVTPGNYPPPTAIPAPQPPTPPTNVPLTVASQTASVRVPTGEVLNRVETYLDNYKKKIATNLGAYKGNLTIKQIQSAIKRSNISTGWTCKELQDLLKPHGYKIISDPLYPSWSEVVL